MREVTFKPVWGFFLHFGYVENSRVSFIAVHHQDEGFDTLEEAVEDLAKQFFEDYMEGYGKETVDTHASFAGFYHYLQALPENYASDYTVFLGNFPNCERWWAWASMRELAPHLNCFFESQEATEDFLWRFVKPEWAPENSRIRRELEEMLTETAPLSDDSFHSQRWKNSGDVNHVFAKVIDDDL